MTDTEDQKTNVFPYQILEAAEVGENIHRAMHAVINDIPPVDKNGEMQLGSNKVKFTRIDDIRDALNPILQRHGVVTYPRILSKRTELQVAAEPMTMAQADPDTKLIMPSGREIRDGKIPTTRSWAEVEYEIRFVFVGDNSETFATAAGQAYDTNSDKALAKATTAAIKRILFETLKITDRTEGDGEGQDPEAGNRAATTDRRVPEGQDRGGQARAAASSQQATGSTRRSGPPSRPQAAPAAPEPTSEQVAAETGADPATGEIPDEAPVAELPAPQEPPAPDRAAQAKARIRAAVTVLGHDQAQVNAIATEVTGKAERSEWITKVTFLEKVAKRLEDDVKKAKAVTSE